MNRRYSRSSIQELELLFENYKDDGLVLEALQNELTHRTTERAAKLRGRVDTCLEQRGVNSSSSAPKQHPLEFSSASINQTAPAVRSDNDFFTQPQQSDRNGNFTSASLRAQLRKHLPGPTLKVTNAPESILSAWTALEVLSPSTFRRPEELAAGNKALVAKLYPKLPWDSNDRIPSKGRLYYQVVLGAIRMAPAIELLTDRYGDDRIEKTSPSGNAALAVVIVDQRGYLVPSPVAVSSFGWGVMTALKGELHDLAQWPEVEHELIARLEKLLKDLTSDDYGNSKPLTRAGLMRAYDALITDLGLPTDWIEPPEFAIRSYTSSKEKSPEPILLNSFYLADLAAAKELFAQNKAPDNLSRYLGVQRPTQIEDLLRNNKALEKAVSPQNTPLARWPGPSRHPLVLLQQAAVNIAFSETAPTGMIGINGPPGTGKTTLLRDLVAGIVTERAQAMAEFDDPEDAFETTGLRLNAGSGPAWIDLYKLDESLKGFEIVVASSNNKAVENVSAELPGINAIADDAELRYFKTISDSVHEEQTWGLIGAVMGNAQNRFRFKQRFWWDNDNGLRSYLRAAAGSIPSNGDELPPVIRAEQPPTTKEEALECWEVARERFLEALKRSEEWRQRLENLRNDVLAVPSLVQAEKIASQQHSEAVRRVKHLLHEHQHVTRDIKSASEELRIHGSTKPAFWARLFRTRTARQWSEFQSCLLELQEKESTLQDAHSAHEEVKQRISASQKRHGVVVIDSAFFKTNPRDRHQTAPWFPIAAQRTRDEVFIAAMALHRAFIDAAAERLKNNLDALMSVFRSQSLPTPEKQALLPDLWASLFVVVPLLSTTFASVNRMLGKLPPESLGWLLIDEAGQASPQSAVGAIMRTKHAVIVGDPVQIEPVVTLPDKLTNAICLQFGIEPEKFSVPNSSVQTLADDASAYSSKFSATVGSRTVGVPLLVHRRCSEPMFTIANTIAYDRQMVWAKDEKPSSRIADVLGPSRWIDVRGSGEDKWCSQEGEEVVRLLTHLAQEGAPSELYIITPFRVVADELRQIIRRAGVLRDWINEEEWAWLYDHVGTVHTAQGREAEAVIIVLGAPNPSQTGARNWAGKRPNLLNVAVTRSKEVVYVVGNRKLWREAGVFADLDRYLP